ncbi:ABC-three component system middle component 1 [Neobacillus sp. LXY-1]|uniref:ABC-three component system middle component 1 n=1 Tax=Neobacillus sp. LXY-1 TaxID=3379133 RepID=UPI003EE1E44F
MFHKSEEIMRLIKELSEDNTGYDLIECWIKDETDYKLHIFTVVLENGHELEKIWKRITGDIALYFQSELEKDIEIWNIYIVFICKDSVSKELKYKIEQNKYSTRKLVIENVNFPLSTIEIQNLLIDKLFDIKVKNNKIGIAESNLLDLVKKNDEILYHLLRKKDKDDIFQMYLEVFMIE